MTIGTYFYLKKYLKNLVIFYDQNVKQMSIKNRYGICKEIETIEKKLKI